jgi:O-antigen ligase
LTVYSFHGFFLPEAFMPEFFRRLFTLLQLLVFFCVASNILQEKKLLQCVLFTYVVASVLLAFGLLLHLPGFSASELAGDIERSTITGYDANYLATLWALAVVILTELCSHPAYRYLRLFLGPLAIPLLIGIMQTGSRAGTGALLIGLLVYLLPYWRSQHKWLVRLLVLLSILATFYLVVNNPATMQRWKESFSERKFSGREQIVPAAIAMFSEHPFLGWQPGYTRELGRRVYESLYTTRTKDAHNLLLHLLLEVGLVGATPFLIGLWLCGQTAWKARSWHSSMLPLALFCTSLAASMSHPLLQYKPLWLVLAVTSASVSIPTAGRVGRFKRLLII